MPDTFVPQFWSDPAVSAGSLFRCAGSRSKLPPSPAFAAMPQKLRDQVTSFGLCRFVTIGALQILFLACKELHPGGQADRQLVLWRVQGPSTSFGHSNTLAQAGRNLRLRGKRVSAQPPWPFSFLTLRVAMGRPEPCSTEGQQRC